MTGARGWPTKGDEAYRRWYRRRPSARLTLDFDLGRIRIACRRRDLFDDLMSRLGEIGFVGQKINDELPRLGHRHGAGSDRQ